MVTTPRRPSTGPAPRAVAALVPTLAVIASAFVIPFFEHKGEGPRTAVYSSSESLWSSPWSVGPFLAAGILAVVGMVALVRQKAPEQRLAEATALALVTSYLTCALALWNWFHEMEGEDAISDPRVDRYTQLAMIAMVVATMFVLRSRRRMSWARWGHLIAAYAVLTTPLCYLVGSSDHIGRGGWVFMGGMVALVPLALWATRSPPPWSQR